MWPWEHAAVAYIGYSLLLRFTTQRSPGAGPVVALLVGSQLPDLVDKPLAWWLHVLPSGRSLGHSLFFALPVAILAVWIAHRYRRTDLGGAFAVGSLLHLPGDIVYPIVLDGSPAFGFLFYPVVSPADSMGPGAIEKITALTGDFLVFLGTSRGLLYLGGELLLFLVALALWYWDGTPGLGAFSRQLSRAVSS